MSNTFMIEVEDLNSKLKRTVFNIYEHILVVSDLVGDSDIQSTIIEHTRVKTDILFVQNILSFLPYNLELTATFHSHY